MCGRFVAPPQTWAELFDIMSGFLDGLSLGPVGPDFDLPANYNVKPTQTIRMAYAQDGMLTPGLARWWFVPHWHKGAASDWKATTFNAKIETAHEKPTFRAAWRQGRCLIPAQGYYEWTGPKGAKQPHYVSLQSNTPAQFMAGLYSTLPDGGQTCTILTRAAASDIAHLHPRMPVFLKGDEMGAWLSGASPDAQVIDQFGTGWDGQFREHEVARFGIHDDDESLIEPTQARLI